MKFNLRCELTYTVSAPTTFIFNISVVENAYQRILDETLQVEPQLPIEEIAIAIVAANGTRFHRINAQTGTLTVSYNATVDLTHATTDPRTIAETSIAKLPLEILPSLLPSRYCQSDRLLRLTQYEFSDLLPGYSRVTGICNWIYDNVTYLSGSTNQSTSAFDTATERSGVCRDFAHLAIAFCRALNIPARFVSGYAYRLNPPDFHAFFEAYLGDRWYLFDATRLVPLDGLIRIGTGRDAADVAFATIFGNAQLEKMVIQVDRLTDQNAGIDSATSAISTIDQL